MGHGASSPRDSKHVPREIWAELRTVSQLHQSDKRAAASKLFKLTSEMSMHAHHLSHPSLGVVKNLIEVVSEFKDVAREHACGALSNIAHTENHSLFTNYKENGLVPALIKVIKEDKGTSRIRACQVIRLLGAEPEHRSHLGSKDLGLVPNLVEMIDECNIAFNFISQAANKQQNINNETINTNASFAQIPVGKENHPSSCGSPVLGKNYENEIHKECKELRAACGALRNIFINEHNCILWAPSLHGIVSILIKTLQNCIDEESRLHLLNILDYMTFPKVNAAFLGSEDIGLINLYMDIFIDRKESNRVRRAAIDGLINLSAIRKNMAFICNSSSNVLLFKTIYDIFGGNLTTMMEDTLRFLFRYSRLVVTVDGSDDYVVNGHHQIDNDDSEEVVDNCEKTNKDNELKKIYVNINNNNIKQVVARSRGLLPLLMNLLKDSTTGEKIRLGILYLTLHIVRFAAHSDVLQLTNHGLQDVLYDVLSHAGAEVEQWSERIKVTMKVLQQICVRRNLRPFIKSDNVLELMKSIVILKSNGAYGLRAGLVIALLVGYDEATKRTSQILHVRSNLMQQIINMYVEIMDEKDGEFYSLGTFDLESIISACLSMCISDSNKSILREGPLLSLLLRTLEAFIDGRAPFNPEVEDEHIPGIECPELALVVLLHLSFAETDDLHLRKYFMKTETGILFLLGFILKDKRFSERGKLHASFLLARLQPKDEDLLLAPTEKVRDDSDFSFTSVSLLPASIADSTKATAEAITNAINTSNNTETNTRRPGGRSSVCALTTSHHPSTRRTHVMIIYCEDVEARPELAIALGDGLKKRGYDVWRKDEGSLLSGPWTGYTTTALRTALDVASHVIICVSPGFKRSAICRMQARYANQYMKKDHLKLLFVMMNQYYTPEVKVDGCDGWLGFMIGDASWYSLWNEYCIIHTIKAITNELDTQSISGQIIEDDNQNELDHEKQAQKQRIEDKTHSQVAHAGSFSGLEDHPEV